MTTPPPPSRITPDPDLTLDYLRLRLTQQIDETAETWSALQTLHRQTGAQNEAYEATIEQLRAEVAQLRDEKNSGVTITRD